MNIDGRWADDMSDEGAWVLEVDLGADAPPADSAHVDIARDPYEVAAERRSRRELPPPSRDDPKRAPSIRVSSTMLDGIDAFLDQLLAEGIYISRSEFFEFAVWHVIGMEPEMAYAISRWRMAGGHRGPGRRRQG